MLHAERGQDPDARVVRPAPDHPELPAATMTTATSPDSPTAAALRRKFDARSATIGVIGLGYVGLPLCQALHQGGLRMLGFDVDAEKIAALERGRNYLEHLGHALTEELAASERFEATCDFGRLGEADAVIVCVPTPIGSHNEPDLSFVHAAAEACRRTLRPGQLFVLESTTYPGTTRDEFLGRMQVEGLACGVDFFVAYSPEREDPGRKTHTTRSIPKLVGGLDAPSGSLAAAMYRCGIEQVVEVESAEVAEAAKLLENIFRAVNIALVNELKTILDAMGIDVWKVVQAAATKPFGFMPFFPGPGLGGHCIPIDPFYLSGKAREVGRPTRFIELAGEINTAMPRYVVERTLRALNDDGKALNGARVLVLGLAYKPNVDDTRESPSFQLIERLRALGAEVDYSDPHIPRTKPVRAHDLRLESVPLTPASLRSYDAVLVATDHAAFDWKLVAEHAALVVDTRNALAPYASGMRGRLVKA
jgi:UDP-N-acetyl-D-glucosamine dehydrogenase